MSTLNDKWKTYADPVFPNGNIPPCDKLLIGHRGESVLDTGRVYSPYVPIYHEPGFEFEAAPCGEPSIIDRIGALADPACPVAKRVEAYDDWVAHREEAFKKFMDDRRAKGLGDPLTNAPPGVGNPPPFFDPSDFSLRKGLRTRFKTRVLKASPQFFTKGTVTDL